MGHTSPLPHTLTKLENIQSPYLKAIEKLRGKQPTHWHLVNPIFSAQYGRQCLNLITEPASPNESFAIPSVLLDCTFPAIIRNGLFGYTLIHLRMALVFHRPPPRIHFCGKIPGIARLTHYNCSFSAFCPQGIPLPSSHPR